MNYMQTGPSQREENLEFQVFYLKRNISEMRAFLLQGQIENNGFIYCPLGKFNELFPEAKNVV